MDIMFNTILIDFELDINNNKILKTKWEHDKKKKRLNITSSAQQHRAQIVNRVVAFFPLFSNELFDR